MWVRNTMDTKHQPHAGKRHGPHYEKRLKAAFVKSAPTGRHTDGGGLYLYVSESGARRWVLRIVVRGRRRDFGLGSAKVVSLAEVREVAHGYRLIAQRGGDPSNPIHGQRVRTISYRDAAIAYHKANIQTSNRSGKHINQWISTQELYTFPFIGNMGVDEITHKDVMNVLTPIWLEKHPTATRVLQRMKVVFDWSIVSGHRTLGNPVEGVRTTLPRNSIKAKNFAAIPWDETPDLMQKLAKVKGIGAIALRFTILTVLRSGSVRKAEWDQFSSSFEVWNIPAENMKANEAFVVPLPFAAQELLKKLWSERSPNTSYVFPSPSNPKKILSENTMAKVMNSFYPNATVHGMRSAFRDWAETFTPVKREVKEAVLAHGNPNKVESAYLRTEYFHERENLMEVWGSWATGAPGTYEDILNRHFIDRTTPLTDEQPTE